MSPIKLITALRKTDMYIEYIFMEGGCYQFHLFLKKIFPTALPYINQDKTHVITKIGRFFYDIKGICRNNFKYMPLIKNDVKMAEQWSFNKQQLIKINECEFCGEPFIYQNK